MSQFVLRTNQCRGLIDVLYILVAIKVHVEMKCSLPEEMKKLYLFRGSRQFRNLFVCPRNILHQELHSYFGSTPSNEKSLNI